MTAWSESHNANFCFPNDFRNGNTFSGNISTIGRSCQHDKYLEKTDDALLKTDCRKKPPRTASKWRFATDMSVKIWRPADG